MTSEFEIIQFFMGKPQKSNRSNALNAAKYFNAYVRMVCPEPEDLPRNRNVLRETLYTLSYTHQDMDTYVIMIVGPMTGELVNEISHKLSKYYKVGIEIEDNYPPPAGKPGDKIRLGLFDTNGPIEEETSNE